MAHEHAAHGDHHALPNIPSEGNFDFTNGKFAMWLFLISDAMAFIGFLGAYMVLRMTATASAVEGGLPWQPTWMLPMDLILTGVNTFVLICSSVTMVKALAAVQDGNLQRLRLFLACTMLGGAAFVGFQVWEWNHFIHAGITMQGLVVPSLDEAMENAKHVDKNANKLAMAKTLFGGRELKQSPNGKVQTDFESGNFAEADYLALPLIMVDVEKGDKRAAHPGVIHHITYAVAATTTQPLLQPRELQAEIEDAEAADRAAVLVKHRGLRAKVSNGFSSTFFVLTGFHGFHVFIGVIYLGIILLKSFRGAYSRDNSSGVEIVGLYWHFVDLVWVLLFMVIYLIL